MLKRVADNHHMSLLAARLEDIYMKDELTGLYNYRGFRAMASMIVDDMIVTGAPLLMISFDIEHLKDINKDWGHEEGDFALQVFSSALKLSLIHISEPTRRTPISYAVFCLKKKKTMS